MNDGKQRVAEYPNMKVLVMDDEQSILKILGKTLQQLKCPHSLATNGSQAIKHCIEETEKNCPYDVAILDLMVPDDIGGLPTAQRMKKVCPSTTLVLSSGNISNPIMANFKEHGFDYTLPKPYSLSDFDSLLKKIHQEKNWF